ncbi:NACHT, LRR and PYD domains-containing protein 3-like [Amblyraja radiata]|uniref:NACHT, LRR and PYD domains-containing protein 3-like n=1 Tax=Amblyraja radiata TaxID=386614 RepID=UPI0014025BE4|nr:NACHT, LRR and PYD domains-containing protein 3-like [Amblyraja radiata]
MQKDNAKLREIMEEIQRSGEGSNETPCTNSKQHPFGKSPSKDYKERIRIITFQTGNQDTSRRQGHQSTEPGSIEGEGSNETPCTNSKQHPFGKSPSKDYKEHIIPFQTGNQDTSRRQGHQSTEPDSIEGTRDAEILHREFLRNWSKNLRVVQAGGEQTAGTRLFDDFYTDLRITGASPEGMPLGNDGETDEDVDPHQLLKRNNAETEETSTILVRGTAGSGKSTLIQKIIHDWATEYKYKGFKYIFSFKFQIINAIKHVTSLNTLVLEVYPHLVTCLEDIWKDPKTILFILDDLDQFEQSYIFTDDEGNGGPLGQFIYPHSYGFVRDILTSLIQGRLVKGCSLLVTTRPWRLEALQEIPATSTYHLTGFTQEKVEEYFQRNVGDKEKAQQLVQLLKASDTLGTLYTNPLFCSIIVSLPEWSQVEGNPMLTMGHTRVLSEYLTTIMCICGFDEQTSRQCLLSLGEVAYKKIRDKTFSFEANSLSELSRCLPIFTSALMMEEPGKHERGVVYKFTYPVLQNFVAALVKSRNTPGMSLKSLLNENYQATDDRFNIFSRFLVGLSSRRSTNWLERVLGSISPDASSSIADWIKESVKTRLSNLAGKMAQGKFLNILHCLFEFGDPQVATQALEPMRTIKFNQCSLNTFDCVVLSRTLIRCGPIEELDLSSCGVKQEGIRYLLPVLYKCNVLR